MFVHCSGDFAKMKTQPDPPLANQPPSPKPAAKPQAERQDKKQKDDDGGGENE